MNPQELEGLNKINEQIQLIKKAALELKNLSGGVQAAECNLQRILASVKMMELNFSDLLGIA
jgi:hypothetical protein